MAKQKDNIEFAAAMPILDDLRIPLRDVIYKGQEEPDIIISNYQGKRIGVEVIGSHPLTIETKGKLNLCQRKNYLRELVKKYKEQLYEKGDKCNWLSVDFKPKAYWDWENDDIILEEIDDCINGRLRKHWIYIYNASKKDIKEENTDYISITESNIGVGAKFLWVEECVKKKEERLRVYKTLVKNKDIDEYWLVVNFIYALEVDLKRTEQFKVDTNYDRVYLVQYGDVKRLK